VGITNITCSFCALYPADRAAFMAGPPVDDWKRNADTFNKVGALCRGVDELCLSQPHV